MASITINSCTVTIPTPKRDNIYTNHARVTYSSSAQWVPSTDGTPPAAGSGTHTWTTYTQGELSYEWTFLPSGAAASANGTTSVEGLSVGSYCTITGVLKVTGYETPTNWTRTDNEVLNPPIGLQPDPNDPIYDDNPAAYWDDLATWSVSGGYHWELGTPTSTPGDPVPYTATDSASDSGYTRPGTFTEYNFTTDTIIESSDGLTAAKVGRWCVHCNKFAHWYNQNGNDTTTANCQATTGNPITAVWYNACVAAIADSNARPGQVTGGPTGSIISASVINALGIAISKGDT